MHKITFLYISIFILLFGGPSLLHELGWNIDFNNAPFYQKLRPEFYVLIIALFSSGIPFSKKIVQPEVTIFILSFLITIYLIAFNHQGGYAVIINAIAIPTIISLLLTFSSKKDIIVIRRIILLFFVTNCFLAILERLLGFHFLPYYNGGESILDTTIDNLYLFRSHALRNHPLSNALLTSIIMSFILITPCIKQSKKVLLLLLGFIALLCYNARSSILIYGSLSYIYILYNIFINNILHANKIKVIFILSIASLFIIYMFSIGYGGRLLEKDSFNDTSIEARFMVIDALIKTNISELILGGMTVNDIQKLVGIKSIENYWFIFLCRFGLVFLALFTYFFYKIFRKWIHNNLFVNKLYTISIFLLISSTNNSIYAGDPAIATFILCAFAFCLDRKL